MAHGLSPSIGRRRWRRIAGSALILVVLAVHLGVTDSLVDRMAALDAGDAMPARIEVVYLREMTLAEPVAATAPIAAHRITRAGGPRKVPAAARPAQPASTPAAEVASVDDAASAPGTVVAADPRAVASAASDVAAGAEAVPASAPEQLAQGPGASTPDPAASARGPAFVWPASTRMSYALTGNFRGPVTGSAQVEWVHVGTHYQVHLDLLIGPEFAPLVTRRMSSDGVITADGLAPHRYDQETKVVLRDRSRATILFDSAGVQLANGERRAAVEGLQDTASQFVQLSYLFGTRSDLLKVGNSVTIPLALPLKIDQWIYDVVDAEPLDTRFGQLETYHLKPRDRDVPRPGELRAEMWFAPQLRYLPVRIRIEQDAATFVDLMIFKRPELAAP